ncbi:MAG: ROK family protein [Propionibacteriaceae bacterium]|nr:ROK family protein [Propionibacteriaceae bacterium]
MSTLYDRPAPRDRTREDIYQLIRGSQNLTRSTLVELTGLSSSTVGHAVAKLLADGRIAESQARAKGPGSGSGRPATILNAVSTGSPTGAIDFGHSHIRVALGDDMGNVVDEVTVRLNVDRMSGEGIELACEHLEQLRSAHGTGQLSSVVAGIPGPVDVVTGLVCSPTILSSWVGLAPARELAKRLGVPVLAENDALLGAYGELHRGAGRHHQDFVYVKASHGVGAGLVIKGQTYKGATGLAGEIGHTALAGRSELCRCGNRGCLEAVISMQSIREQIAHTHPHLDPSQISPATLDDPITARILNEAGRTLGKVLADLCNLLNPTALIIGGELGASGPALIDGVRASVNRFAQPATAAAIEVMPAALGRRAELVGALQLAGNLARP